MATPEQKAALIALVTQIVDTEDVWEQGDDRGRYLCHECGQPTGVMYTDRSGCTNRDCWIESAKILLRFLVPDEGSQRQRQGDE